MNGYNRFWDISDGTTKDELFTAIGAYLEILGLCVGEAVRKTEGVSRSKAPDLDADLAKLRKEISCIAVVPLRTHCQYLNEAFLVHFDRAHKTKNQS